MSLDLNQKLKSLAEQFRASANAVELRHGREKWVQSLNVIYAYEDCAQEIEKLISHEPANAS